MPLEYAIRTVTPIIPTLGRATLKLLPMQKLSTWLKEVGFEQLGEQLATDINAQLAVQQVPATPNAPAAPSVYGISPMHQIGSAASILIDAIMEALEDCSDKSDEDGTPGFHDTSLFGSRHQTPQNAPVPLPKGTSKSPFRLALPPIPPDQKRARKGVDAPRATDVPAVRKPRVFPASAAPHPHTLSESGWPDGRMKGLAGGLRFPIQRARAPLAFSVSRATPSVIDNGSEYTSGSTPDAGHGTGPSAIDSGADHKLEWSKSDYSMAGSSERAAETIERLKQA